MSSAGVRVVGISKDSFNFNRNENVNVNKRFDYFTEGENHKFVYPFLIRTFRRYYEREPMQRQLSVYFTGVDSLTPLNESLSGKYLKSFAFYTIKERLPVILTNVVDLLVRNKDDLTKCKDVAEADLKTCLGKISKLKNEVQTNKNFIDITSEGDDVHEWNEYLALQIKNSEPACWFESPWLYAECYMYRRLYAIFEESTFLNSFDYFSFRKEEAFEKSLPDVKLLGGYTAEVLANHKEKEKEYFLMLIKVALWGNRCDLSISSGKTVSNNQLSLDYVKSLDDFLLHDDSRALYEVLATSHPSELVLDYVTDNAGFELFCDFCFCDFLCTASFVSRVRFHVKKFPWYVSDATPNDIKYLINKLSEIGLQELGNRWQRYFGSQTWTIHDEHYWTMPFDYGEMPTRDPDLYHLLCQSNYVVFKGDLNYRKLSRDINWKHSEKYDTVLGKFRPASILALRTIKSELICGLTPGKTKDLPSDLMWMRTGEYAVIQLWS